MQIGKFIFGMRGHDLGSNFEEMCDNSKKFDITRLQLALAKTITNVDFDAVEYSDSVAEIVKSSLEKNKLKVSVLGCYIDPVNEKTLEANLRRFENFILYAKALNATVIGTETGWRSCIEETYSEENYARFIKSIERLLPVAEKNGVNIGIEPVWTSTVYSIKKMKKVLDYFKSDSLNVIFDPVNLINAENYEQQKNLIDEAVDTLGNKIKSLHLKDYVYNNGEIRRVPVGLGQFDISYCLKRIGKLGTVPDIMLDEMPLSDLAGVRERLEKIII